MNSSRARPIRRRSRSRALAVGLALALPLVFASCASKIGIVNKHRPIAYEDLPKSTLNSNQFSKSTDEVLHANGVTKRSTLGAPAKAIATLEPASADPATRLAIAEVCLRKARTLKTIHPESAVAWYLAAAERSYPAALGIGNTPEAKSLAAIYNHSAGQVAKILHNRGHDFEAPSTFSGDGATYTLVTRTGGPGLFDPDHFEFMTPSDQLVVRGLRTPVTQPGIGASLVVHHPSKPEHLKSEPFLPPIGRSLPATATLEFDGRGKAILRIHDVIDDDSVRLAGKTLPLAADFTAPLAAIMSTAGNSAAKLAFKALLDPSILADRTGLYFLEPFRRDEIPVVLVHGLMSNPATWLDTYNELSADPVIREKYQFWYFVYPTGNPVGQSAAALRSELAQLEEFYAAHLGRSNFHRMVIVGHSMGGLVSNLQVRDGGDSLWSKMSEVSIDELAVDDKTRETMRASSFFKANPRFTRAIFASAPHRGSKLANKPVVELATKLIHAPFEALNLEQPQLLNQMTGAGRSVIRAGFTGVSTLRLDDPRLLAFLEQPMSPRVTYHSIVGDRGKKGPLKDSSDGVVPYYSSHLEGAASEKVVPSHHGSHQHPEGVAEIHRILLEHIGG